MAALRFCGVTPARARILPASLSFSSASASSSRSTVTKLSPAFSAIFSAWSNSARGRRREVDLAGAAARHLRHLAERRLDRGQGLARAAAGAVDQPGREPFRVVEQDFEHMLGGELLVALAQRQGLRGLDETARPLGEFLEIHQSLPRARPRRRPDHRRTWVMRARRRPTDVGALARPERGVRCNFRHTGDGIPAWLLRSIAQRAP